MEEVYIVIQASEFGDVVFRVFSSREIAIKEVKRLNSYFEHTDICYYLEIHTMYD